MKYVHFEYFPSSFSPTSSCLHFLPFLLSISIPLLCLQDKWRKTSLDPQKNQARRRLSSSLLAGDRDQVLCARGGRESLCTRSCSTTGSEDARVSLLSQLPPTLPKPLGCCSFPRQTGHNRAADQQERRSIGWKTSCTRALTALWLVGAGPALQRVLPGLGACGHGLAKHFHVPGCGTQRDSCPVLCAS